MAAAVGILVKSFNVVQRYGIGFNVLQQRCYAARKGTRARKEKKKVKKEVVKLTFQEKIARFKKENKIIPDMLDNDHIKAQIVDDVYISKYFKTKVYSLEEALKCIVENCHPSQFDLPLGIIHMRTELNMVGIKKTRFLESFSRTVLLPHVFDHGDHRTVLAFSKDEAINKQAVELGATHAGGVEVIKAIQKGELELNDFNVFVATPDILPELMTIRGLLKKKFPSIGTATLGPDMELLVRHQLYGIRYVGKPYPDHKEHGKADVPIGTENMDPAQIEENIKVAVESVMSARPKRPGSFITRIRLICPSNREAFKLDHRLYVADEEDQVFKTKNELEEAEKEIEVEEAEKYAIPVS